MRCLIAVSFLLVCAPIHATPGVMNYQAKLTDSGGVPITTPVNLTFTFWNAGSGGIQLGDGFSDTDIVTPDSKGVCSTDIGDDSINPIPVSVFSTNSVYLNVNVGGTDITPRERISSSGFALNALALFGPAYVIVDVGANPAANGTNLVAAYDRAKALTPHGQPLAATNRAVVLVVPGNYDMTTGELTLDTQFVDLVGLSTKREEQYIFGQTNGNNTGVLRQTANDVGIENLLIQSTRPSGSLSVNSLAPAAYFPDSETTKTKIRNCEFRDDGTTHSWSMRIGITYPGDYENCTGGLGAFGERGIANGTFKDCVGSGGSFGGLGIASGTFVNCTANDSAFGGFDTASGDFTNCSGGTNAFGGSGRASGNFTNCSGGVRAFGGFVFATGIFTNCTGGDNAFGGQGSASGTFDNCTGGNNTFGGQGLANGTFTNCVGNVFAFGGGEGTASGNFTDCTGTTDSFGGNLSVASGTFKNCTGGSGSFGSSGIANGSFTSCSGGERAFGGPNITHTTTGTATGTFTDCTASNESFGGAGGKASGTFSSCTGGVDAFGGAGIANGSFSNCTGSDNSFGGDFVGVTTGARLYGCRMTGTSYGVPFRGRMENCFWQVGFTCSSAARIYGSIIAGTLDLGSTAAGVTGSRAQSIINDASNVFGATNAIALNLEDTDVN